VTYCPCIRTRTAPGPTEDPCSCWFSPQVLDLMALQDVNNGPAASLDLEKGSNGGPASPSRVVLTVESKEDAEASV
jgi:hypothetical protein